MDLDTFLFTIGTIANSPAALHFDVAVGTVGVLFAIVAFGVLFASGRK